MLVSILVVTGLFVTLGMLALQFVITQNAASRFRVDRERAIQIAEAGVDYYRWHLAHVPDDYQDGTGAAGSRMYTLIKTRPATPWARSAWKLPRRLLVPRW